MQHRIIAVWQIFISSYRANVSLHALVINRERPFFTPCWQSTVFFPLPHFPTVLWTAQGQFLVENSEASTINRNTGMFWALLQCRYWHDNVRLQFFSPISHNRRSPNTVTSTHYFIFFILEVHLNHTTQIIRYMN